MLQICGPQTRGWCLSIGKTQNQLKNILLKRAKPLLKTMNADVLEHERWALHSMQ